MVIIIYHMQYLGKWLPLEQCPSKTLQDIFLKKFLFKETPLTLHFINITP